jgi:outer membrane receptor for ferrienterochelin and colicins
MRSVLDLFLFLLVSTSTLWGQNRFAIITVDSVNGEPIVGANVSVAGTAVGATTDTLGRATIAGIPNGRQTIIFSCVGYKTRELVINFPVAETEQTIEVRLTQTNYELEAVTVTTARTSYHLYDAPVRIEVKGEEDIGETMIDHPSSISELFLESTGIQVLQTSSVSNFTSIKLQGLDGSYTQILKDGFPLYGGLSAGLSVTQIPPLDLNRVEIIKGPSSALYGSGAIAGIINLISKKPSENGPLTVLLNGTSLRGIDAGAFYSNQKDNVGITMLLNGNSNAAYDADRTGFSDIPERKFFVINPKFFYDLNNNTKMMFGISTAYEDLAGGDMTALNDGASVLHPYIEKSTSQRSYTQLELTSLLGGTSISFKNSVGYFYLRRSLKSDHFKGTQWTSYTEFTAQSKAGKHTLTAGLNVTTESFSDNPASSSVDRSFDRWAAGFFGQDDWQIGVPVTLETGLRIDRENHYGVQMVPRIAGIYHVSNNVGLRASAGLGYKVPSLFSDQSDPNSIFKLNPLGSNVRVERSIGGEFDCTYSGIAFGMISFTLNQALFYTRINDPLVPASDTSLLPASGSVSLSNADGYLFSRGAETDIKLTCDELEAFIGYTYTDAEKNLSNSSGKLYLTPPHRFVMDILFDMEKYGEGGIELRYTGSQLLRDGAKSPDFWVFDALLQKKLSYITLFVAVENLLNFKAADHIPVVTGDNIHPRFNDVWAPLEGRVVNAGLKFQM